MPRKQLEKPSILSAFSPNEWLEIGLEGAEGGIDALLNDDVVALIPGASIAKYVLKLPKTLQNKLFERALVGFLGEGENVDREEWRTWVNELEEKDGGLDRAGQLLLRTLSGIDDAEKAKYLGRIYAAAAKGNITIDEMYRMQMVLDRSYLPDLLSWRTQSSEVRSTKHGKEWLANLGVLGIYKKVRPGLLTQPLNKSVIVTNGKSDFDESYNLSKFGRKMLVAMGLQR